MDYAKKQLEKYGWIEGQGLGKKEDGITTAIKPKLKFDHAGIGHSIGKEFTDNWWNNVYQNALNNIEVKNEDKKVKMSLKEGESIDITTKPYLKDLKKKNVTLEYGSFIKTSTLTQDGIVDFEKPSTSVISEPPKIPILNDDELFAACDGRTAHKGARHGLKLSGKLSRIDKQEKMLLKKLQNVSLHDDKSDIERKVKKIVKHKDKHKYNKDEAFGILNYEDDSMSSSSSSSKKQKKKKKRKSVSFNKTVTAYYDTHDLDSSVHSSDSNENSTVLTIIEKSEIKDEETEGNNSNNDASVFDEGIEQDIETDDIEECNNKSFLEAQDSKLEGLSKAEKILMKKKSRATVRFLQEMNIQTENKDESETKPDEDDCKKCAKRKQEEHDNGIDLPGKRICVYDVKLWIKKEKKKMKKKEARKAKKQQKRIESITKSLDMVCKISDNK